MTFTRKKTSGEIRTERLSKQGADTHLILACLWPKKGENLGTAIRTCDAVGATMAVPATANATKALHRGNTIGDRHSPYILIDEPVLSWLYSMRASHRIVGVELAHNATPLADLDCDSPTVVVVGHEVSGIPQEALPICHEVVEIPMQGVGNSLNVSVAASLVLYKVKGWT